MQRHYFDHNATTPVDPRVLAAMLPHFEEAYGNASSLHSFGQDARRGVEQARRKVASQLGCDPRDVVFTSGGTEADNLAVFGIGRAGGRASRHVITSQIEHPAVLNACQKLEREGVDVTYLPAGSDGCVSPADVRAALRPDTVLVTVMHANNELGTIQPIERIAEVAREAGVPLHSDGVQSFGKVETRVRDLGVDMFSLSAHKIYGPKGAGALYIRRGLQVEKVQYGASTSATGDPGRRTFPGLWVSGRRRNWRDRTWPRKGAGSPRSATAWSEAFWRRFRRRMSTEPGLRDCPPRRASGSRQSNRSRS